MTHRRPFPLPIRLMLVSIVAVIFGCEVPVTGLEGQEAAQEVDLKMSAGPVTETADVFGQGMDGDVVAEDGARIRRTRNGISVHLSMSTPEPGTYTYPSGPNGGAWTDEEGPPEAFSLWVFVFDDPEDDNWTGAFLGGGHVVDGPKLTLSGDISVNTEPFLGKHLENPQDAEVHLAVAPHGALDSDLMPEQIQTPTGPGPDIWWLALFK